MSDAAGAVRILAICAGNICRSPTAEAAIREAAAAAGLEVAVDSAGTGNWHAGDPPDPRMRAAAAAAGLEVTGRARQVTLDDFDHFDLIVAMDRANQDHLLKLAPTPEAAAKVRMFMPYAPETGAQEVPDPYYRDASGFVTVVSMVRSAARGLIDELGRSAR
ncbi:MAG TPA: low molecular weight protein-tyrosine-phosphatase [Acidimicrobiia bacterium]|jgi:protein-tyrosine phosphatase